MGIEAFWLPIVSEKIVRYVKIKDAWTELSNPHLFGAICAGELSMACDIILRGNLEMTMVDGLAARGVRLETIPALFRVNFDCAENESSTLTNDTAYFVPMYSGPTGDLVGKPRPRKGSKHETSAAKTGGDDSPWRDILAIHDLALRSYGSIQGGCSRVGFFTYDDIECGEGKEYADLMELVEEQDTTVAEDVCEVVVPHNEGPSSRFIFNIV